MRNFNEYEIRFNGRSYFYKGRDVQEAKSAMWESYRRGEEDLGAASITAAEFMKGATVA